MLSLFCFRSEGKGKLTLPFSAEHLRISTPRSPPPSRWLYPLKPGGGWKSADVWRKMVTLIYPDPRSDLFVVVIEKWPAWLMKKDN